MQRTPKENIMKKQSGFTLIELVLVIIVLGILSATAMPRFVNLSDDAKNATYASARGAMQEAVNLVHMKWNIDGQPIPESDGKDEYQVGDVYTNKYGYPRVMDKTQGCETIFSKLLPGSGIVFKKASTSGGGVSDGNVCNYYFKDGSFLMKYDEGNGKVVLGVDPAARN